MAGKHTAVLFLSLLKGFGAVLEVLFLDQFL